MKKLITLLKEEKEIIQLLAKEEQKQKNLDEVSHEQSARLYKKKYYVEESSQMVFKLYNQINMYEEAKENLTVKQRKYLKSMVIVDCLLLLLASGLSVATTLPFSTYILMALASLTQIPLYHLYINKEKKILTKFNISKLREQLEYNQNNLKDLRKQKEDLAYQNQITNQSLDISNNRLKQLQNALERIEKEKSQIEIPIEYHEEVIKEPVKSSKVLTKKKNI